MTSLADRNYSVFNGSKRHTHPGCCARPGGTKFTPQKTSATDATNSKNTWLSAIVISAISFALNVLSVGMLFFALALAG